MTKISALTPLGDDLAVGDQFIIRDIGDAGTPNKSVTISGITRGLEVGTALAPSIAFAADKNTGIYGTGSDVLALVTAGENRLHITSGGLVGIGTTIPEFSVDLRRGSGANAYFLAAGNNNGTTNGILFGQDSSGLSLIYQYGANPITFWTNTEQRARIDSSGRLLVGTTTHQGNSILQLQGEAGAATAAGVLYLRRGLNTAAIGANVDADLGKIQFGANDGTVAAHIQCLSDAEWSSTSDCPGRLVFSTTSDSASSPTERMRIKSDGDVSIVTGNLIIGTAGKGIDFSATANGSGTMTNELLSDYEEGTWLPNVGGTATYSSQSGFYTKIGNIVHVQCNFTINVIGTGDTSRLSGLPFPSANLGTVQSICVGYYTGLANSITWLSGYVENSVSTLQFTGNSTAATTIQNNGLVLFANSTNIVFSASYRAA